MLGLHGHWVELNRIKPVALRTQTVIVDGGGAVESATAMVPAKALVITTTPIHAAVRVRIGMSWSFRVRAFSAPTRASSPGALAETWRRSLQSPASPAPAQRA